MITAKRFLEAVEENAARVERYEKGGDGTGGGCDCIGLIIGALKKCGEAWTGTHGSNWAARNAVHRLFRIESAEDLSVGEIVFKAHEPGEAGYDAEVIERSYKDSPDKRDYYHVGVVTQVTPLEITHCTSVNGQGGIYVDYNLGKWNWSGWLKKVDPGLMDEDEEEAPEEITLARVWAETGKTVRLRIGPGTSFKVLDNVPIGDTVEVYGSAGDGWKRIGWNGVEGYMMDRFLSAAKGDAQTAAQDMETLKKRIKAAYAMIQQGQRMLQEALEAWDSQS